MGAALDASGNGLDGKPVTSIPRIAEFTDMVFQTPQGETSNIEEARNGGYFLFRVDSILPPQLQPLDAVRSIAIEAWKLSQVRDVARKKAQAIVDAAKTSGSFQKAAEEAGLAIAESKPFTRFIREPGSPVSPALSTELFKVKPGSVVMAASDNGYGVAELKQVIPAETGKNQAEADALREQLESAMANDQIDQFLAALRKRYTVKIYPTAVEQLVTGRSTPGYGS